MSNTQAASGHSAPLVGGDDADPSMEEILASIRRILNDDETTAEPAAEAAEPAASKAVAEDDDVLILDDSMIVAPAGAADGFDVAEATPAAVADREPEEQPDFDALGMEEPEPPPARVAPVPVAAHGDTMALPAAVPDLVAPEAAAAAASSVGTLVRTLAAGRSTQVYGGGPTLEDMVRAELRLLLKEWLDANLPPMVERLVRIEIERVVGRCVP